MVNDLMHVVCFDMLGLVQDVLGVQSLHCQAEGPPQPMEIQTPVEALFESEGLSCANWTRAKRGTQTLHPRLHLSTRLHKINQSIGYI